MCGKMYSRIKQHTKVSRSAAVERVFVMGDPVMVRDVTDLSTQAREEAYHGGLIRMRWSKVLKR